MKRLKISKLMDGYTDEEFFPGGGETANPEAVKARVLARVKVPVKKRPRPHLKTVLIAAALAAVGVLCVAAGLPMTTYQLFTGGTMVADVEMSGPNRHIYSDLRNAFPEDPLVLEDGRLWLVLNGERTDITDRIDMETPYIVEHTDPETGLSSSLILGGTSEDFGWCLWQELPNQGGYSAYGYNYRATHFVYDGVAYEVPYGDNLDESLLSKENDWEDVKIVWQPWCEKGEQEAQVFARNR